MHPRKTERRFAMDYTRQQHDLEFGAVNEMLAWILELCQKNGLNPNDKAELVGSLPDGRTVRIVHTSPAPRIAFVGLEVWANGDEWEAAMNIKYVRPTRTVSDSTSFDLAGKYQSGHIQVWMNPLAHDELGAYKRWYDLVQSASNWHLEARSKKS